MREFKKKCLNKSYPPYLELVKSYPAVLESFRTITSNPVYLITV